MNRALRTQPSSENCASNESRTGLSCVLDYFTTLLPLLLLWRANMKRHNLIILYFFLGLGVFTASCSLGRAITAHHAAEPYGNNARTDFTWRSVPALMFNLFEQTCGIVVASLPILRQLLSSFSGHKSCLPLASACSSDASGKTRRDTTRPKKQRKGPTAASTTNGSAHKNPKTIRECRFRHRNAHSPMARPITGPQSLNEPDAVEHHAQLVAAR